jgi:NAD+ synthetase
MNPSTATGDPGLRITCAQINPTVGDITGNIALMLRAARLARDAGAAVVVFPELTLTGYYPGDLLDESGFQQRLEDGLLQLKRASRETPHLHWVVGLPLRRPPGVPGKAYANGLLVLLDGQEKLSYAKQLLPTYNVFDERRHFEPGPDVARVFKVGATQIGVMICEDGWDDLGADYHVNPYQRLADAAPDLIVSINASPSSIGKREQRHRVFGAACARLQIPLLYVNQIGGHDQLVYDGASFAVDGQGHVVFEAARFEPDVATLCFDAGQGRFLAHDGTALPAVPAEGLPTLEFYRRQIVLGLRDYTRRCGFAQVIVGCSGGIDSALTLVLAAQALGPQNVTALTMPSMYSSEGSVTDSRALCHNLGIRLDECAIQPVVSAFTSALQASTLQATPAGIALENLQARVRGTLLMTCSNMAGSLLLTTGNKSEISIGYCTLFGDTNGGLGLIGDLYKTEVFALCRHLNATAGYALIPQAILDKPPSAELAPGQKDTDSLPPYEVLDDILRLEIEPRHLARDEQTAALATCAQLVARGQGAEIDRVRRMIARNEYKRRQMPPILRLRGRAFGAGRQMPIAAVHL